MKQKTLLQMRKDARRILQAGIRAVEPGAAIMRYCQIDGDDFRVAGRIYDLSRFKNIYLVGAGKAAAPMALALEEILKKRITEGVINVKYGHLCDLEVVRTNEGGHPIPDQAGKHGTKLLMELAEKAKKDDLVLCVISGGGSALLPMPSGGITLDEKQETTRVLLACGATIHEVNAVRKHLSRVKGGGLARAVYPATLVSLILSDVIGDNLDVIASGPTVPDPSTFQDCKVIFDRYSIRDGLPESVFSHIERGVSKKISETPKPGDSIFTNTQNVIVGSNLECVNASKKEADSLGYHTMVLSTMIEGETKEVAKVHSALAKEVLKTGNPAPCPACLLSGGETTVTIMGQGKGGRNQEFVLASALELEGWSKVVVLSGGTDGTDGPTDAAGALADGETVEKAHKLGMIPRDYLEKNDSYHFFEKLGDLVKTGPTNTNVMDLRIILTER